VGKSPKNTTRQAPPNPRGASAQDMHNSRRNVDEGEVTVVNMCCGVNIQGSSKAEKTSTQQPVECARLGWRAPGLVAGRPHAMCNGVRCVSSLDCKKIASRQPSATFLRAESESGVRNQVGTSTSARTRRKKFACVVGCCTP